MRICLFVPDSFLVTNKKIKLQASRSLYITACLSHINQWFPESYLDKTQAH